MSTKRKRKPVHNCRMIEMRGLVTARDGRIVDLSRELELLNVQHQAFAHEAAARQTALIADANQLKRHLSAITEALVLVAEAGRGRRL